MATPLKSGRLQGGSTSPGGQGAGKAWRYEAAQTVCQVITEILAFPIAQTWVQILFVLSAILSYLSFFMVGFHNGVYYYYSYHYHLYKQICFPKHYAYIYVVTTTWSVGTIYFNFSLYFYEKNM